MEESQSPQSSRFRSAAEEWAEFRARIIHDIIAKNRLVFDLEDARKKLAADDLQGELSSADRDTRRARIAELEVLAGKAVAHVDRIKAETAGREARFRAALAEYSQGKSPEEVEAIEVGVRELYRHAAEHEWPWRHSPPSLEFHDPKSDATPAQFDVL